MKSSQKKSRPPARGRAAGRTGGEHLAGAGVRTGVLAKVDRLGEPPALPPAASPLVGANPVMLVGGNLVLPVEFASQARPAMMTSSSTTNRHPALAIARKKLLARPTARRSKRHWPCLPPLPAPARNNRARVSFSSDADASSTTRWSVLAAGIAFTIVKEKQLYKRQQLYVFHRLHRTGIQLPPFVRLLPDGRRQGRLQHPQLWTVYGHPRQQARAELTTLTLDQQIAVWNRVVNSVGQGQEVSLQRSYASTHWRT